MRKKYELPPELSRSAELSPELENQTFFTLNFQYRTNYPPRSNPERFCLTWRTRLSGAGRMPRAVGAHGAARGWVVVGGGGGSTSSAGSGGSGGGTRSMPLRQRRRLMLLAAHPEWQDRAHAEVLKVCGGDGAAAPDFDMVSRMRTEGSSAVSDLTGHGFKEEDSSIVDYEMVLWPLSRQQIDRLPQTLYCNTQDIFYSANGEPQMESMENVADSETVDHQLVNLILNDPRVRLIKNLRMIQRFGLEVHRSKILGPVDPSMRIQELNFWDFQKFRYESYEISPRPIPNASHV
uniref:Uncharacterized protein n=1 Tax=Oryza sativa subsp. indica TaxID=39946 RepID=C5NNV9_ORYSI|nr:hypothetical protein [Oryza sativa Indica Group]